MKKGKTAAFWDSSALVPLLVHDSNSLRSRQLIGRFREIRVWWLTLVEIQSALIRLRKGGQLSEEGAEIAGKRLIELRDRWREIRPVDAARGLAVDCLKRYRIRSADALQLAAALIWSHEKPKGHPFICFDSNLADAARQAGFELFN